MGAHSRRLAKRGGSAQGRGSFRANSANGARAARATYRAAEAPRASLHVEVTARIIAELEEGRLPWVQPWDASPAPLGLPRNAATGRSYSGINILILWDAVIERGHASQNWLTFRQALDAGGCVRKGEKGVQIFYADRFTPEAEKRRAAETGDEPREVPFLKRFTVFNVAQCYGLPDRMSGAAAPLPERETLPVAEALIAATGADFRIGGSSAFYSPAHDFVQVPPQPAFRHQIDYYRTALHELGHWTGHRSRLARDLSGHFGSENYAREELCAELASAFLCAALSIVPTVRHADYIGCWLEVLRGDERAIFRAASHASKAADFLLAFSNEATRLEQAAGAARAASMRPQKGGRFSASPRKRVSRRWSPASGRSASGSASKCARKRRCNQESCSSPWTSVCSTSPPATSSTCSEVAAPMLALALPHPDQTDFRLAKRMTPRARPACIPGRGRSRLFTRSKSHAVAAHRAIEAQHFREEHAVWNQAARHFRHSAVRAREGHSGAADRAAQPERSGDDRATRGHSGEPDHFEIVAGRRRYVAACEAFGASADAPELPCAVMEPGDDAAALEASLIENVARANPHEVEQWESFTKLVKEGRTPEEIALVFGLTGRQVAQVLALGNLLPKIRDLYRREEIDAATVRYLTMATSKQQKEWLTLFADPNLYAPRGINLKSWLFGGASIPTSNAIFDLASYKGGVVADLFGEDSYFACADEFWDAQREAVETKRQEYLGAGWADAVVIEPGCYFHAWEYEKTAKRKGGKVFIALSPRGEVAVHEGYLTRAEARRKSTGEREETEGKPARAEVTSSLNNHIDLHRHAAVRAKLANHGPVALRLMAAHAISGSYLFSAKPDPQRPASDSIAESVETCAPEAAFDLKRRRVLDLLGFDADSPTVILGYGSHGGMDGTAGVFLKLLTLTDEQVLEIVAVVMARRWRSEAQQWRRSGSISAST